MALAASTKSAADSVEEPIEEFAARSGYPLLTDLQSLQRDPEFLNSIPIAYARRHGVVLCRIGDQRCVLLGKASSLQVVDVLRRLFNCSFQICCATTKCVQSTIDRLYESQSGLAASAIVEVDRDRVLHELSHSSSAQKEDLLDVDTLAPVVKVVNLVLFEAVQSGASDVHFQPTEHHVAVRYRIDGTLHESFTIPKGSQAELVSRIKVMAELNVAETRLAQDGRATATIGSRNIDLRISIIPTSHGERAVIRLLDKGTRLFQLEQLGMAENTLQAFRRLVSAEHGLLLVTGPTGSGKSTTLYAAMQELDSVAHNILTIEDPIEYELTGISQTPVASKKGMTFASALRNVLRQDPDVIMVGEIRDAETAHMAVQAALTGHLVLTTLHTNDAASAVGRMLDLGIEPFLLSSCLIGSLAQRLVRRPCPACGVEHTLRTADIELFRSINVPAPASEVRGSGCSECRGTGYRRRVGLFELLTVNAGVQQAITRRLTTADILRAARNQRTQAYTSLLHDGLNKVRNGLTTCNEVRRVALSEAQDSQTLTPEREASIASV